jgi:archaellum component FlaC
MQMTLEERERRAYIEGRTDEAELLAQAVDTESFTDMEDQLSEAKSEIDRLEDKVQRLERELEEAADKAEQLESEAIGLREQITEAGIDLL